MAQPKTAWLSVDLKLLLLLLGMYYLWIGFSFGVGNNVEEIPMIYYKAGVYEYPNDPFVSAISSRFNVITIYTNFFAQIIKITGVAVSYTHLTLPTILLV